MKKVVMRVKAIDNKNKRVLMYTVREHEEKWVSTEEFIIALVNRSHIMKITNVIKEGNSLRALIDVREKPALISTAGLDLKRAYISYAFDNADVISNTKYYRDAQKKEKVKKEQAEAGSVEKLNDEIERRNRRELNKLLSQAASVRTTGGTVAATKMGMQGATKEEIDKALAKMDKSMRMDKRDEEIRRRREELKKKKVIAGAYGGGKTGKRKVTTNFDEVYGNEEMDYNNHD